MAPPSLDPVSRHASSAVMPSSTPSRSSSPALTFRHHRPTPSALHCCCGNTDCAILKRNSSVLETVEKDVHTAAQLGQALLARHEAYMADAERDRLDLTSRIERLEMDKQALEANNAAKIEENRFLLDQLEALNNTVSDSDAKIKSLEASLLSSQQTIRRLETAAARAADAERHLAILEDEQDRLHLELRGTREDSRSHAQRFKEAQRGILDMQDQLERMEVEAREERDRHAQVISRMERQREVEKQLDTAAGRLKGAAASKNLSSPGSKAANPIVGHFVRDLLQDNANLQLGIAELREMLMNSNDEIQSLRDQLMQHQPVDADLEHATPQNLQAELEPHEDRTPKLSQELHIHHHYHVGAKQERKPKKKRPGLTPGVFSGPSTPSTGGHWRLAQSPAPAVLSQSSRATTPTLSMPTAGSTWGGTSNPPSEFASSVPSSPRSNQRNSLFDQIDTDLPMSPTTSFDPMSPTWRISHSKRPSEASARSFQTLNSLDYVPDGPPMMPPTYADDVIHEEDEDADAQERFHEMPALTEHATSTEDDMTEGSEVSKDDFITGARGRLHRAVSHESIMSLTGGLDIHTLKARPSQLTLRPLLTSSGGDAVAEITGVTARPTLARGFAKRSDAALRDHFVGAGAGQRAVSGPVTQRMRSPSPMGSFANRWAGWRPWGGTSHSHSVNATPSTSTSTSTSTNAKPITVPTVEANTSSTLTPDMARTPRDWNRPTGINQAGAIPGFQEYWAAQRRKGAPARVNAESVDRDALEEGLSG